MGLICQGKKRRAATTKLGQLPFHVLCQSLHSFISQPERSHLGTAKVTRHRTSAPAPVFSLGFFTHRLGSRPWLVAPLLLLTDLLSWPP